MFTYVGQDAPNTPTFQIIANSQAAAAQSLFLADLDPVTIDFFDFEGLTPDFTDNTPPRAVTDPGSLAAIARFDAYGATGQIPARVLGRNEAIVRLENNTNQIGTWATSGSQYLLAAAYDGSNNGNPDPVPGPAGTTQTALQLSYNAADATPGRTPKPFSSFGAYITDTEGYGTIRLTLFPSNGDPAFNVDYNGILNQGITTAGRGNGQLTFIGFTDFQNSYDTILISFTNRKTPPAGQATVTNEAFGFDDFIVGEVNQVRGPDEVAVTDRVLDQVDEPGWRLLSAPVRGLTVDDLAQQNLVQGVDAGDGTPAQYPEAGSNFYISYEGGTRFDYTPVPTTDVSLRPGRGFWWYWYDLDLTPNPDGAGGGTSASVELDNFQLSGTGPELLGRFTESFVDNTNCASNAATCPAPRTRNAAPPATVDLPTGDGQTPPEPVTPADDDFYMVGNPFTFPMDFSAVTASGGTMGEQGFIWNPDNQSGTFPRTNENIGFDGPGSYEVVFKNPMTGQQGAVAVWNGVLVEVAKDPGATSGPTSAGQPVVFTFDPAIAATAETPLFHGKGGPPQANAEEAYIQFALFGETDSGVKTRDEVAYIRFSEDARFRWDPMDASKPTWLGDHVGLVGVEGLRDRERAYQAVKSLPARRVKSRTRLALNLTEAGTYDLVWNSTGLKGHVRDIVTGERIPLSAGSHVFTAEATGGDWSRRFVVKTAPKRSNARNGKTGEEASEVFVGVPSPNPTRGAFALDVAIGAETTVSVFDALGRRVSEAVVSGSEEGQTVRVSTDGFAPGAYLVVVEAEGVRETRRVTVVR